MDTRIIDQESREYIIILESKLEQVNIKCSKCFSKMWVCDTVPDSTSKFIHRCVNCGHEEIFNKLYPYTKL